MEGRKLYNIKGSDGKDRVSIQGFLTDEERIKLLSLCKQAGIEGAIEEPKLPVGLDEVLDEQDWGSAYDLRSLLELNGVTP
jgi:hypothetical protein